MAIEFAHTPGTASAAAATPVLELQPYDIEEDRQKTVAVLAHSEEIEALTATIDISDMTTIVTFGASTAEEISKASDVILRSMNMSQLDESSKMLGALSKIMDQFDLDELRNSPMGLAKLFGGLRKQLDKILAKYHTMGDEVDKIYIQLKQYESEIKEANKKLDTLFEANVGYFHELEKYIVAGDQGCAEIAAYIEQRTRDLEQTGDQAITFEIQSLQQAYNMLEQRTADLRTAETVALQSIPMIKTMEFSNLNLVRKIDSAFIVTLPVFKQALAQAIMLKRQKIQADAISALDQRTNEMLLKNARTSVEQAKATARLAAGSSIKADTLETSWRTIMNGIDETKRIQETARNQRMQDQKKLENIKSEFMMKFNMPASR